MLPLPHRLTILLSWVCSLSACLYPIVGSASLILTDSALGLEVSFDPVMVHDDRDRTSLFSPGIGGNVVSPGSTPYGVNMDGVGKLVTSAGGAATCTGTLLESGMHVLTAGHCGSSGMLVEFALPTGTVTAEIAAVTAHPNFTGNSLMGYDVAIATLTSPVSNLVPRYDLNRSLNDVGITGVTVGFGDSGLGVVSDLNRIKRAGLIEYETVGLGSVGISVIQNNQTQLTADFDYYSHPENDGFAVHFGLPEDLGFGDDEVGFAPGDSGGPTFFQAADGSWAIGAVASHTLRLNPTNLTGGATKLKSDIDDIANYSYGEFSVAARVSDPDILNFIDSVAGISVNPVPEPSSLTLLFLGALLFYTRRRHPSVGS